MRAARRRTRNPDLLASPEAVRSLLDRLRERLPGIIPNSEKQLRLLLYAVRHVERRPATDTRRGRPPRRSREDLLKVAGELRRVLERETSGRVSLGTFIGQYLPVLRFPSDVADALRSSEINLQEAAALARVTPDKLGCSAQAARARRGEMLRQHLAVRGPQTRLRERVKEILGETAAQAVSSESMTRVVAQADELLEIDPQDSRHLFWEEMKRIFYAMREVRPEDLDEETLDEFMAAMDGVSAVLHRLEKRRRSRELKAEKLKV